MSGRFRETIRSPDAVVISGFQPLSAASEIRGVRVFDVGQGDSIAILADMGGTNPMPLQLDYGGSAYNPFVNGADVDAKMPVSENTLVMLTHWDEDHWKSASRGSQAKRAKWLVPRQLTSPRAVEFSATVDDMHCIPEKYVGRSISFSARNGDYILAQKIGSYPGALAADEDCNKSGVALAVIRGKSDGAEAILLPGDAPFDTIAPFVSLAAQGVKLRAIVAFHHGAGTHWTESTENLLRNWPKADTLDVIFSCSRPNAYGHPDEDRYTTLLPQAAIHKTVRLRSTAAFMDILF
ncbi:hypothetical protein HKD27_12075 [Gluconobacter sp. R75690]|uniref:hypothetical protein n=1 Tax=unclassified Gluconobacter TaxID=2644261 RepID=UPI00188D8843|nr:MULTISPECIES: hypothetical protein [unclassified Gluconobacter]MBF0851646.1 hypothetical protein [Gluconobacter sp. R75690]MBF0880708.1 hypothetical protein [Gluconobacter sp. R75828]